MPVYPIFEVNQGSNTILKGGTYNTDTQVINPGDGTDPATWANNLNTNQNLYVVYETEDGQNDYQQIQPSIIAVSGTSIQVTGILVPDTSSARVTGEATEITASGGK